MPWQEVSTVSLRKEFVMLMRQPRVNRRALCRRFNVSPKTGYKLLHRYLREGDAGLQDRSRRPHHSPRHTHATLEAATVALYLEHGWGGRKLHCRLTALGYCEVPSPSTLTAILHRHGLIDPEKSSQHRPWQRFEYPEPNALWQMDFKGHFPTATARCHPLTVLDDHSRFNLTLHACADEQGTTVKQILTPTFRRYGLPQGVLIDNGPPWSSLTAHRLTQLSVWLTRLGIRLVHSRPYHPQTLGKDERFHRTLNQELIARHRFTGLKHCQRHFQRWRHIYNCERPHEALGLDVPAEHYQPSPRAFPESLPDIEYAPDDIVRKVQAQGELFLQGRIYRVPKCLRGHPVALRPTDNEPVLAVYLCNMKICEIDPRNPYE